MKISLTNYDEDEKNEIEIEDWDGNRNLVSFEFFQDGKRRNFSVSVSDLWAVAKMFKEQLKDE